MAIENTHSVELELKAEQVKHEMDTAWRIQQKFLPEKLPTIKTVDMCIKLKPAKEIGGDYFNVIKIDDENFLFFVADVSGKSISAALIVSTVYSFLQFYFIVQKNHFNTTDFVESFNRFLIAATPPDKFVTAWLGFYNHTSKEMISINAGHNPPYYIKQSSDTLTTLNEGGSVLGTLDLPYVNERIPIYSGDLIVFYTDGIPEAMNPGNEEFGEKRFEELLIANKDLQPNDLSRLIFDNIKKYRGNAEQSDDITLGILKFGE